MDEFSLFLACEKGNALRAATEVASDPLVFAAVKKWGRLNESEKISFFERSTRLAGEAMQTPQVTLESFKSPKARSGSASIGDHSDDMFGAGVVRINLHPDVFPLLKPETFLELASHEMTHEKQKQAVKRPRTYPPQFASFVPQIFQRNLQNYRPPSRGYDEYRNQPLEQHAFLVGETFAAQSVDFVRKRKFLPNPYSENVVREEFDQILASRTQLQINLPQQGGVMTADPYRHYYAGLLSEKRLAQPGSGGEGDPKWRATMDHYQMALLTGEYLSHNAQPALDGLSRLAKNNVWDDSGAVSRRLTVPAKVQAQARAYLAEFADSDNPTMSLHARRSQKDVARPSPVSAPKTVPQVV